MTRTLDVVVGSLVGCAVALAVMVPQLGSVARERDAANARLRRVSEGCAVRLTDGYTLCKPGVVLHVSQVAK